jgi:hypothetical protein
MPAETTARTLDALLDASQAAPAFKEAVRALSAKQSQARITSNFGAPPVKVLRVTMKLLEERPDLPIESLDVRGASGCSNFTGKAVAQPGPATIEFNWDCAWRAAEEGWKDAFGEPDQIRAAQTLGYQCFERFEIKEA